MRHSGGIVQAVLELGFDSVKFFEGPVGTTAIGFTIEPPARRLVVNNRSSSGNVYLRINGGTATPVTTFVPGDNIRIGAGGAFAMDFDALREISFVADAGAVDIEGLIGFKGTAG